MKPKQKLALHQSACSAHRLICLFSDFPILLLAAGMRLNCLLVLQDFFDLKLIPSDTDYRMYSYRHGYGNLPGIDIATILDAEAYHTDRDASNRIRPGTLQVCLLKQQAPPSHLDLGCLTMPSNHVVQPCCAAVQRPGE